MRIQEMSFMIIGLAVFFAIVLLFYLAISLSGLRGNMDILSRQKNVLLIAGLAATPEFACTDNKVMCVDSDKLLALKNHPEYSTFWNVDGLKVEKVFPLYNKTTECSYGNYPKCSTFTLVANKSNSISDSSFIVLCRKEYRDYPYDKCELAKIVVWTEKKA
jgi:hypothetical protein